MDNSNKILRTSKGEGNICECGEKVIIDNYLKLSPINYEIHGRLRIGFCKCGNIFLRSLETLQD